MCVEQVARLCFNRQDAIVALLRGSQIPRQVLPDALLDGELGALLRENTPAGPFPRRCSSRTGAPTRS